MAQQQTMQNSANQRPKAFPGILDQSPPHVSPVKSPDKQDNMVLASEVSEPGNNQPTKIGQSNVEILDVAQGASSKKDQAIGIKVEMIAKTNTIKSQSTSAAQPNVPVSIPFDKQLKHFDTKHNQRLAHNYFFANKQLPSFRDNVNASNLFSERVPTETDQISICSSFHEPSYSPESNQNSPVVVQANRSRSSSFKLQPMSGEKKLQQQTSQIQQQVHPDESIEEEKGDNNPENIHTESAVKKIPSDEQNIKPAGKKSGKQKEEDELKQKQQENLNPQPQSILKGDDSPLNDLSQADGHAPVSVNDIRIEGSPGAKSDGVDPEKGKTESKVKGDVKGGISKDGKKVGRRKCICKCCCVQQ